MVDIYCDIGRELGIQQLQYEMNLATIYISFRLDNSIESCQGRSISTHIRWVTRWIRLLAFGEKDCCG